MKQSLTNSMVLLSFCFVGCGQADTANEHLASLDQSAKELVEQLKGTPKEATEQLTKMAESIAFFQTATQDMLSLFKNYQKNKAGSENQEPAKTDNIDDVLGKE